MSVNYNVTVKTNRLQQVVNAIDAGASNGFMRLLDNRGNVASSLQLSRPCGTASNGVLTFNGMPLLDAAAVGSANPVNSARFEDSTGTIVISGLTVGGANGGYDIAITPSTIINAGQTVAVTAATITGN